MTSKDQLQELWGSQTLCAKSKGEDIMTQVQKRLRHFDRMISTRNLLESTAALFVIVFFVFFAFHDSNFLQRLGDIVVATAALWIVFYLFHYGKGTANADPNQSLTGFTRSLVAQYDHQIRLLRSVKYWYLLPLYVGLVIATAGGIANRAGWSSLSLRQTLGSQLPALIFGLKSLSRSDFGALALITAFFGLIWWLNESYSVGRLRKERARLLSITGHPPGSSSENET